MRRSLRPLIIAEAAHHPEIFHVRVEAGALRSIDQLARVLRLLTERRKLALSDLARAAEQLSLLIGGSPRARDDNESRMRVTILPDRQVTEVDARTVADLLKALGLLRDAHIVVRGEDILTSDVRLAASDELEVWPVISGGA